jgi:hypothetical protein
MRPLAPSAARAVDDRGFAAWRLNGATTSATLVPDLGGRIMSCRLHALPHDEGIELLWQRRGGGRTRRRALDVAGTLYVTEASRGTLQVLGVGWRGCRSPPHGRSGAGLSRPKVDTTPRHP